MDRGRLIFLDTSVWIAAVLSNRGASFYIVEKARTNAVVVISSPDVFEEGVRNLRKKYPDHLAYFLYLFRTIHPVLIQPTRTMMLQAAAIVHPDDVPILAAAMQGEADILLTLDRKHFIVPISVAKKSGLSIMTPAAYLQGFFR